MESRRKLTSFIKVLLLSMLVVSVTNCSQRQELFNVYIQVLQDWYTCPESQELGC